MFGDVPLCERLSLDVLPSRVEERAFAVCHGLVGPWVGLSGEGRWGLFNVACGVWVVDVVSRDFYLPSREGVISSLRESNQIDSLISFEFLGSRMYKRTAHLQLQYTKKFSFWYLWTNFNVMLSSVSKGIFVVVLPGEY